MRKRPGTADRRITFGDGKRTPIAAVGVAQEAVGLVVADDPPD
jgi:hypothetical protein